jgi:hypothetical protein
MLKGIGDMEFLIFTHALLPCLFPFYL